MNLVRRTEKLLGQIHYGNAAEFHGYPKSVVIQLTYIIYTVRYAVGFVIEGDETFRFRVKQYHSSIGSYPYVSAFVFVDTCHFVAGQAVGGLRLVCEVLDCLVFYGKYTESPVHMPDIE